MEHPLAPPHSPESAVWKIRYSRKILWLGTVLLPLIIAGIVWWQPWVSVGPHPADTPARQQARLLYDQLDVVPLRITRLGYERSCAKNKACSFGPPWSDNTPDPLGHNGRDTRTDMLLGVTSSLDMYTGSPLPKQRSQQHVDHLYPLAAAWDFGAWQWPASQRELFANDTQLNLVVVSGRVNMEKGDATPSEWLPPWKPARCWYAYRYMQVAVHYALPVSEADRRALHRAIHTCPRAQKSP